MWQIILAALVVVASGQSPKITLYAALDGTGAGLTITSYQHDLREVDFNDVTDSVCGVGAWLLYEDPNYSQGDFTHVFVAPEEKCENLPTDQRDKVTSVRYVGAGDLHLETLTLYQHYKFSGDEYLVIKDEDYTREFNDKTSTLAVTGPSSWTLYKDPYYTGTSACVVPKLIEGTDVYFGSFRVDDLSFPDNSLSSLRKGCHSKNVVVYQG